MTGEEPPTNTIHVSGIDSEEGHGTPAVYESANEEWLFDGYMQALERFQQAVQRGDVPEPAKKSFLSLFETLEWAASLIEKLLKPKSATKGKPLEEKVSVMQGVRYVRNRLHHQWAFALRGRDVPQPIVVRATGGSRVIGPVVVFDWFWKPLQELPPPDQGQPDDPSVRHRMKGICAEPCSQSSQPFSRAAPGGFSEGKSVVRTRMAA